MTAPRALAYGKANVRVLKVDRDDSTGMHTPVDMTVMCLLEGSIETSYTAADNSVVVATDSIKNTIHIKAFETPVNPPELYAATLGAHFLTTYPHISVANVRVEAFPLVRIVVDGVPHKHAFVRATNEARTVTARISRADGIALTTSLAGLTVLKTTGSAFHGFVRDEYTTLPETWDRILSTDVDAAWSWAPFRDLEAVQAAVPAFDPAWDSVRDITLKTFAEDDSASVQNTMYKMCEQILAAVPGVATVSYELPNKHHFEIDLSWFRGYKNTGADAKVYAPQTSPNGLIKCEVSRT